MWFNIFGDKSSKRGLLRRLHKMHKKVDSMHKHLPDVSKHKDMLLNDMKFNLGVELLRLRGKINNTSDEIEYDRQDIELSRQLVNQIEKEFHLTKDKTKAFFKQIHAKR